MASKIYFPEQKTIFGMDIMVVNVYLGSKCNLNCDYCLRVSDDDVPLNLEWVQELQSYKKLKIFFKGGEPLLYIKDIIIIADMLPQAEIFVVTNGIGIKNNLHFLKRPQVTTVLSYDFAEENRRHYEPDFTLLQGLNYRFETTLYHGNCDINKILDRANDINQNYIHDNFLRVCPHTVHYTNAKNKEFRLTKEDYDNIIKQYKDILYNFNNISGYKYKFIMIRIMQYLQRNNQFGDTHCNGGDSGYRIDLQGNRYFCMYDRTRPIYTQKDKETEMRQTFPKCEYCEMYRWCGASCVLSLDHETECYYNHNFFAMCQKWLSEYQIVKK